MLKISFGFNFRKTLNLEKTKGNHIHHVMMTYIKNIFLTIIAGIYLLHSSFALGLSFFGHHEKSSNESTINNTLTCESESENCCSSSNSCVQLCVSEEYQTISKAWIELHEHNEGCDNNTSNLFSLLSSKLEDLYIIPHINTFSEKNLFVFDETDLVWIIKLTI